MQSLHSTLRSAPAAMLLVALACIGPSGAAAAQATQLRAAGHDHYFNLEYDQALRSYYDALEVEGQNASLWNHIATTLLYQELNRLGKLETSAFKGDNPFLDEEKPKPDPQANRRFLGALGQARKLAEAVLERDSKNRDALFSLSQNYGLEANYLFMIDKSFLAALRSGNRARKYSNTLRELYPEFVDSFFIAGVQEYVVGSLPWAVRTLVALGGVRGNKERGRQWVLKVADEGVVVRNEARVLMALLYRRERMPSEATEVLEGLIVDFPRNYVLRLELAGLYLDAQRSEKALDVFRTTRRMVRDDEQRFGRMPQRLRRALDRKIETLETADPPMA